VEEGWSKSRFYTLKSIAGKRYNVNVYFKKEGEDKAILHCNPLEDLLPQRMHTGNWHGDKAFLTPGK
jgi:hypothetical protein